MVSWQGLKVPTSRVNGSFTTTWGTDSQLPRMKNILQLVCTEGIGAFGHQILYYKYCYYYIINIIIIVIVNNAKIIVLLHILKNVTGALYISK